MPFTMRCPGDGCPEIIAIRDSALGRPHKCKRCKAEFPLVGEFGRYRVERKLGRGGMGDVYQAIDTQVFNRKVALKRPRFDDADDPDDLARRFLGEARALAGLDHPNICSLLEGGGGEGDPFLTMRCVEGRTLADSLDGRPLPSRDAANAARTIARAMAEAHDKGVSHRDLKPSNIMVDRR